MLADNVEGPRYEEVKCWQLEQVDAPHISQVPTSSDIVRAHGLSAWSSEASDLSFRSLYIDSDADKSDDRDSVVESSVHHRDLYELLAGRRDAAVLFGWWPKAARWTHSELCERTTRCLPAVRPNLDLVALPDVPEVRDLYSCWAEQHSMAPWQAIWFAPCLDGFEPSEDLERPRLACQEVFAKIPAEMLGRSSKTLCFYPMYLLPELQEIAERHGARILGDKEEHQLGLLNNAKAWLHPHINEDKRGAPSLHDSGISGLIQGGARGPHGYIASSTDELLLAFRTLRVEMPHGRFVLKPSWASGGEGIIIDVTEDQLKAFTFPRGEHYTAVLEEFIEGRGSLQSPALYMIGSEACGPLADQVLSGDGVVNDGNKYPSALSEEITQACVSAAKAVQSVWCLTSQWGLDFVFDKEGAPIIVDLNMGRPNGNFAVRLWESKACQRLCVHSASWVVPQGLAVRTCYEALARRGLLWSGEAMRGVLVYQFMPGQTCSFAVASAEAWTDVEDMTVKFTACIEELGKVVGR